MEKKSIKLILVLILFIASGLFYYQFTGKVISEKQTITVSSVIDGDTIKDQNGQSYRLLGINTPEKKMPYYQEAKDYLLELVTNKTVQLETKGKDKYDRTLAYITLDNKLINQQILQEGLATLYYYGEDNHYNDMKKAEEQARNQQAGLWKRSENSSCIGLIKLNYTENGERCTKKEQLILNNECEEMQVILKDDANHIETINLPQGEYTQNFSCIFNDEGDSLYIRDNSGLILFYRY